MQFFLPSYFTAPLLTLICSPAIIRPGWRRAPLLLVVAALWSLALIPPYFYATSQLGALISDKDGLATGIGLLSASLLVGLLAALNAWRTFSSAASSERGSGIRP